MFSRKLGNRLRSLTVAGERIVLIREGGKVYALRDRCPHRGIPLCLARREFEGTITCCYHGWTFDVTNGDLVAALTDGPDSPLVGRVTVPSYPVEVWNGLIWVWIGDREPSPIAAQLPSELLTPDARLVGRIRLRPGNWRYAAENGFDESHAKYLHRTALLTLFRHLPAWTSTNYVMVENDSWLKKQQSAVVFEDDYPNLGRWPKRRWYKRQSTSRYYHPKTPGGTGTSLRLPGLLRVASFPESKLTHYEWYVPVDLAHHLYLQVLVRWSSNPFVQAFFWLRYQLYWRLVFHIMFNGQDGAMVEWITRDDEPERLFRPDKSVTQWRQMVERSLGEGR
jgi:phenylpropionate dioxygenase-like ring-hydroxylating dioxygenase large terminal subunit